MTYCPHRQIIIKGVAKINFPTNETVIPHWAAICHIVSEINPQG